MSEMIAEFCKTQKYRTVTFMISNNSTVDNELNTKEGAIKTPWSPLFVHQHFLSLEEPLSFIAFVSPRGTSFASGCGAEVLTGSADGSVAGQHLCRILGCFPGLTGTAGSRSELVSTALLCQAKKHDWTTGRASRTILHNTTLRRKREMPPRSEWIVHLKTQKYSKTNFKLV